MVKPSKYSHRFPKWVMVNPLGTLSNKQRAVFDIFTKFSLGHCMQPAVLRTAELSASFD
jgi:hypothetical protein